MHDVGTTGWLFEIGPSWKIQGTPHPVTGEPGPTKGLKLTGCRFWWGWLSDSSETPPGSHIVASPEDPDFLSASFGWNEDPGQCLAAQCGIMGHHSVIWYHGALHSSPSGESPPNPVPGFFTCLQIPGPLLKPAC